ncbi:MAG: DUF6146 family protein [Bacteroidota bacterium]
MKNIVSIIAVFCFILISCSSSKPNLDTNKKEAVSKNDTIRIANDELQYEVIIIDPGFNTWLNSRAYPRNYHTQSFLENKNRLYVGEWNNRVLQPQRYPANLYEMSINYDSNVNYGYEVNYLIYNYMIYFQNTYKQKLYGYVPVR